MNVTFYLPPLALAISLVYSASRYELPAKILSKSMALFFQIMVFMGLVMGVLYFLSYAL
ncbi:hypothetical protein [Lacunimicrobium album]|jgi:hypothetical protein